MSAQPLPEPHVELRILSQPRYLCGTRELVASIAKRLGFDDLSCSQVALAVDEALCNVMKHGYGGEGDHPIWLRIWPIEPTQGARCGLRIVIEDEGAQTDPERIKGRELDEIRPGGLGVHIIRQVMDVVRYEKCDAPVGMRLTMEKLAPATQDSKAAAASN